MSFDDDMSLEEEVARLVASDTDGLARRVKEMSGRSFGVSHLTPDQEMWAWTFKDDTINPDELRAAGMPESEVNAHEYPLRPKLMDQAGRTFNAQKGYHDHMELRRMRGEAAGRVPKPPARTTGIEAPALAPPKEL